MPDDCLIILVVRVRFREHVFFISVLFGLDVFCEVRVLDLSDIESGGLWAGVRSVLSVDCGETFDRLAAVRVVLVERLRVPVRAQFVLFGDLIFIKKPKLQCL